MEESPTFVSTRQAAELLGVHESSVKRWCNAGDLACTYTPGGHRRIVLDILLAFARLRELETPLLALTPFEERAWLALDAARSGDAYGDLAGLLFHWLEAGHAHLPDRLCDLLLAHDIKLTGLFDRVLTPALEAAGQAWARGDVEIGDAHRMTQHVRDVLAYLRHHCLDAPEAGGPVAVLGGGRTEPNDVAALMARLVLEQAGWTVVYLGPAVPTEAFAQQQKRHGAALVVVLLAPKAEPAEAWAVARLLAHLYDDQAPYRLAVGGSTPFAAAPPGTAEAWPFRSLQDFGSMAALDGWLDSL